MAQRELCETKQNRVLDAVRKNPSLRQFEMAQIIGCKNSTVKDWFRDNTLGWNEKYKQALRDAFNSLEGPAIQCMTELIRIKTSKQPNTFWIIRIMAHHRRCPQNLMAKLLSILV